MRDICNVLSSDREHKSLYKLLDRIHNGITDSQSNYDKTMQNLFQEMTTIKKKRDQEMQALDQEFRDFRLKNNLDEYFKKYLSDDTRKQTLHLVDDLMK